MKNSVVFLAHFLLWTLFYAIFYIIFKSITDIVRPSYGVIPSSAVYQLTSYMLIGFAIPFYSYYALFPKLVGHRNRLYWYALALAISISLPIVFLQADDEAMSLSNYITSFLFILFFSLLGGLFRSFFKWIKENNLRENIERQHLKSELALLRAQINPHFLFNSLHNIDTLIKREPETASNLLVKLSGMMRYMLYDSDENKVSLIKEIEYIENFISLQRLRLKDKDSINYRLKGDAGMVKISPMLLIPFVENAFKHYVPKDKEDRINIELEVKNEVINLSCSNRYSPNDTNKDKSSGIGLNTVKRRLELIYHDKHDLLINKANNIFDVKLTIPLNEN